MSQRIRGLGFRLCPVFHQGSFKSLQSRHLVARTTSPTRLSAFIPCRHMNILRSDGNPSPSNVSVEEEGFYVDPSLTEVLLIRVVDRFPIVLSL